MREVISIVVAVVAVVVVVVGLDMKTASGERIA